MFSEEALNILFEAMKNPKRAKNDAGEIEAHQLDELTEALELVRKYDAASSDPLSRVSQSRLPRNDVWM